MGRPRLKAEEIRLTAADEAALDRAWARVSGQKPPDRTPVQPKPAKKKPKK